MSSYQESWVASLIEDLYVVKDISPKELKESVQQTIDLLDDLILSGYTYSEEDTGYTYKG